MWFDHHSSQEQMVDVAGDFKGRYQVAPSAARVIYEYYDSPELKPYEDMLVEVDRVDSANLTVEDITNPEGWVLLSHTCDPRAGLSRFQDYFLLLTDLIIKETPIEEILEHPEVKSRTSTMLDDQEKFAQSQREHSRLDGNVIVTDLRGKRDLPSGNRFLIFTLFPEGNVQARVFDGINDTTVVAVGLSIFNRTSKSNVGELLAGYGGGGHRGTGTAQFAADEAEEKVVEVIARLKAAG
ncbi:MAG: exopolyphosphatase [Gammaproteobacteria bacterium]|jgi:hypothetical protein|nr:exopolyphosphatase [Gammaproteobacteria bacterium]